MKTQLLSTFIAVFLFITPNVNFGQAPNLGSTSSFALFTAGGAFSNAGASVITGDIGSYTSSPTGFPAGIVNGNIYTVGNPALESPFYDVATAFSNFTAGGDPLATPLETHNGTGFIYPGTYSTVGAAALNGNFTLDAQGDPNAIFVINIKGRLDVASLANIFLINAASVCNVYWQIDGAFALGAGAHFEGTVIANGAISLLEGSSLLGSGLSTAGAIELHNNVVTLPICTTIEELTIEKVADKSSVSVAGELITYTIKVVNTGNVDLTGVVLTDVFAADATLTGGDDANTGVLDIGETWTYTAHYEVTQDDINAGTDLVNVASVVTEQTSVQQNDVTTTIQNAPLTNASLTIVKIADKSAFYKAGQVINYTITVANTGNVSLTGVQVKDTLSKGKIITELAVYPDGGDLDGDNVLDVGETWIYKANYTVTQSDIDYFISTKSASLLKCAAIVELINLATVVTNQTKPQSDDATSILETYVLGNNKIYRSSTKVANRRAAPVTFSEAGTINSISIYHNGGTGNVLLGVYSNQSSSPLTRLGVTESTVINPKAGWQTVTLSSPVKVASGQTVWLSWVFENNPGVRYTTGTPGRRESTGTWSSGMPETFGAANYAAYKYSIYCSYTTDDVATLAVSPASISLNYSSGASATFDITSNTNWSITDDAEWLDVSSVSGINNGTITLTANSANTGTNPRTATVSIAGAGVTTKTVTVIQDNQTTALGNTKVFSSVTKVANRRAVPVTFSEAGTINSISIYHNGGTGNVLLGVYSNQSGSPLTRLGVTESTAINPIAGWQTVSLLSPVKVISGQTVWLSWVFQNNPGVRYTTGTPGRKESTGTWSSGMPETFGTANYAAYKYSIFCSYIADESKSAEIATEIEPAFESADLKVYPNPFSDKLRFEFVSPESVNARIDLYDMTGRMVKTIFEQPIEGGVNYEAEFEPDAIISGMYIYRMKMGDAIYNGKVIFKKE